MSMSTDWDAAAYHAVADPQFAWGQRLLATLALRGDETVMDAGCGSGRLTRLLLERLPRGRVIAVDLSPGMLETAREHLDHDFRGQVEYVQTDLLDLTLRHAVDVVFSTATFHWVADHPRLFANLARALRPGGRLLAQFGGQGNVERGRSRAARILAEPIFGAAFDGWTGPWHYPDARLTADRLREAGFTDVETSLFDEPTTFVDPAVYRRFLATVVFRVHLQRLSDPALRETFLDRCVEAAARDHPPYTLDYRRLNARAVKPPARTPRSPAA